jgi:anthranilate synthase component 1
MQHRQLLADTLTPVNIYLKVRDVFAGSILLESSDYHGHENSLSFICCDPIASFRVERDQLYVRHPAQPEKATRITHRTEVLAQLDEFRRSFSVANPHPRYPSSGLFGYLCYDCVRFFEDIDIASKGPLPDVWYQLYRYVMVVDHFSNQLVLCENSVAHTGDTGGLDRLEKIIFSNRFSTFPFRSSGTQTSNVTDAEYQTMVTKGIAHCLRGDVFQIVLSRRFTTPFQGDEFNVYRALRSINPSPYLFYFDYGSFKLFGSSPEAQIQIKNDEASIFPIAGTFRRTGNDQDDAALAERLARDEKENAEHVMLVDLARNDLSRAAANVTVEVFKEIQYYSHVIHLVSKVTGRLAAPRQALQLVADTFPAGTLSGAPKHMAMQLIQTLEPEPRGFYGGAIGYLGFSGDFNHAIMIRTFLSHQNQLICQAGAGVVAKSRPENELQEVNNKLEALKRAIVMATQL